MSAVLNCYRVATYTVAVICDGLENSGDGDDDSGDNAWHDM